MKYDKRIKALEAQYLSKAKKEYTTYAGYDVVCRLTGEEPVTENVFNGMSWLSVSHQSAWIAAGFSEYHKAALAIYNALESSTVSKQQQARALQNPINGVDVSDLIFKDGIGADDFVDAAVEFAQSIKRDFEL